MMPFCYIWGQTDVLWKNANWKWSECSGALPPIPVVVVGNQPGVDAELLVQPWQEETFNVFTHSIHSKRFIKLVCKIDGKEYKFEREVKDFPVKIGDIRTTVDTTSKIDLKFNLEE